MLQRHLQIPQNIKQLWLDFDVVSSIPLWIIEKGWWEHAINVAAVVRATLAEWSGELQRTFDSIA